jgi:hypothetical protein
MVVFQDAAATIQDAAATIQDAAAPIQDAAATPKNGKQPQFGSGGSTAALPVCVVLQRPRALHEPEERRFPNKNENRVR